MLRCLNQHSKLTAVHDLHAENSEAEKRLFLHLRENSQSLIDMNDTILEGIDLSEDMMLVFKNAVWLPKPGFRTGFGLIRNPFSIALSTGVVQNRKTDGLRKIHRRWTRGIAPELFDHFRGKDNLEILLILWNIKIHHLLKSNWPIVYYEDFVREPERVLRGLLGRLNLGWEQSVLDSHLAYEEGEIGHGRIKLWQPIHSESAESYRSLDNETFDRIHSLVYTVLSDSGYDVENREVSIRDGNERRVL